MNFYIIHDASGNIVSCGSTSEMIDQRLSDDHTQVWTTFPSDIENYRFDIASSTIVPLSQNLVDERETEEAWVLLRSVRESILSSTDWTQSPDSPLTDAKKAEWAAYRQALRDLPSNTTDPANPAWPTQPE